MSDKRITKIIKDEKEYYMEINQNMSIDTFKKEFSRVQGQNFDDYELYDSNGEKINFVLPTIKVIELRGLENKNSSEDKKIKNFDHQIMRNNNDNESINPQNKTKIFNKDSQGIVTPGETHQDEGQSTQSTPTGKNNPKEDEKNDETSKRQQININQLNEKNKPEKNKINNDK